MVENGLKNMNEVKLFATPEHLFQSVAEDFAHRAMRAKSEFTVVLSGGNTPKMLFDTLTEINSYKKEIPWNKIKFFFGDERYVPADDPKSNYHMAYEHLFSKVPVLKENIYRIPTEFNDPKAAATAYEQTLRKVFQLKDNEFPKFDLLYLGLGEDGHTASLLPLSDVVMIENNQLAASLWVPDQKMYRITLTPPAINHAMQIVFLVTGENKAHAVSGTLEGPADPQHYPAQLIHGANNKPVWYLDKAAANKLNKSKA